MCKEGSEGFRVEQFGKGEEESEFPCALLSAAPLLSLCLCFRGERTTVVGEEGSTALDVYLQCKAISP